MSILIWIILGIVGIYFASGIRIIYQYERGIKFTFGSYSGIMNPGLNFLLTFIQTAEKVDTRQQIIDLPAQEVMTQDKVNLKINGVVFYSVEEPEKVVLNIKNLEEQLSAKSTTELKEIIAKMTMSEGLENRDKIAKELKEYLKEVVEDKSGKKPWGIDIRGVQINNIELPEQLVRAMSKQAEAEREKEARVTKAQGEFDASKKFGEASKIYKDNPQALRLRELQTYQEIGTENNTIMMVIPETMTNPLGNWILPTALNLDKKKA